MALTRGSYQYSYGSQVWFEFGLNVVLTQLCVFHNYTMSWAISNILCKSTFLYLFHCKYIPCPKNSFPCGQIPIYVQCMYPEKELPLLFTLLHKTLACLIYTFFLSFSSSFAFQLVSSLLGIFATNMTSEMIFQMIECYQFKCHPTALYLKRDMGKRYLSL